MVVLSRGYSDRRRINRGHHVHLLLLWMLCLLRRLRLLLVHQGYTMLLLQRQGLIPMTSCFHGDCHHSARRLHSCHFFTPAAIMFNETPQIQGTKSSYFCC